MRKRNRNIEMTFWVSDEEKEIIEKRMNLYGGINRSSFLRKMALDGYIINFDVPELDNIISLLRRTSNNINQIAIKVNATGVIYPNEIAEIQQKQTELWCMLDKIIAKFSKGK